GLAKQHATFAVAEDDVTHQQITEQRRADFSGEWAVWFPMHVLRSHFDALRCSQRFHHLRDRGEWRDDHNLHIGNIPKIEQQRLNKTLRLRLRHVHLPIRRDNFLTHKTLLTERTESTKLVSSKQPF